MQKKYWSEYTGNEQDETLLNYVREMDWIQPRERLPKGFSQGRIYRIKKIFRSADYLRTRVLLEDDHGKERKVLLNKFKNITIGQRESVIARIMNESKTINFSGAPAFSLS
jgi:hypothetical protein